ncbi:MAG: Alpha-galactosidase, partial [Solirubrobacteraceae bacterium]|nr:Alpha-galactosidase [Solirubrobacteraceae bacterium]
RTGASWAAPGPDFQITVDEAPTSSVSGWSLASAQAARVPGDPSRPQAGRAVELVFTYRLVPADGVGPELIRSFTLHPGSAVVEAHTELVNHAPVPLRVGAASLDQITAAKAPAHAEVLAYHGGSDWRDDYRVASAPKAPFDQEGEVARFDDGGGAGWFSVSGHRGGSMFRAGLDSADRAYVGVDWPRDAFDYGPLKSDPPDYNRQDNPLYPVPVRERLVAPLGGVLDLGAAYTGVYSGGAQEAGVAFADDFTEHVAPRFTPAIGANSFHPWNHGPGMSDPNLRAQIDAAKALGIERYMLDDQWQGGPGGESGDWNFDPARFPDKDGNGVPDLVDYMHAEGVQLGLWMSPLEFHVGGDGENGGPLAPAGADVDAPSQTYEQHPDWACAPTGDATAADPTDAGLGVWDVTNPGFRSYLTGVIDRLVRDDDVREFKFDFMSWVDCAPHDYLDYEDAFVSLVREFQRRHPDVQFELDETNDQRSWPFESATLGASWFDNGHLHGSTAQAKLIHDLWTAAPWLPTSSIGMGALDGTLDAQHGVDELMPIALLSHVTFWTDLTKFSDGDAAKIRGWLEWYRRHRATLAGAAYELTDHDPLDGTSWAAFEPWHGGRGVLFAFRQASAEATQTFALHGVRPARTYAITDARTGELLARRTGAELRAGLTVTLPDANSAQVLQIDPVSG